MSERRWGLPAGALAKEGYIRSPYEPGVLGVWRKTPKKNFVI